MTTQVTPVASYRGSARAEQRGWTLALSFQEVLTAVVRVRFGRQSAANAESFRTQMTESLRAAAQDAIQRGYPQQDVQLALYAVVAFIDESVLNSRQPVFADWARLTMQQKLFGDQIAGEVFFDSVQRLLQRNEGSTLADLLEIFYICLLLGYRGRYAVSGGGDLRGIMGALRDKIQRIRGASSALSPRAALPTEGARPALSDPWVKRLAWTAAGAAVFTALLFVGFKLRLISGVSELRALAAQVHF